jgi:hypothetical protein
MHGKLREKAKGGPNKEDYSEIKQLKSRCWALSARNWVSEW